MNLKLTQAALYGGTAACNFLAAICSFIAGNNIAGFAFGVSSVIWIMMTINLCTNSGVPNGTGS